MAKKDKQGLPVGRQERKKSKSGKDDKIKESILSNWTKRPLWRLELRQAWSACWCPSNSWLRGNRPSTARHKKPTRRTPVRALA